MAAVKVQKFTKTPFIRQAKVISSLLKTNPIINDDEKESLNETVGILTWLNQVQLHWAKVKSQENIPADMAAKIFEGRKPESPLDPQPA